jgi:hypothetical protein
MYLLTFWGLIHWFIRYTRGTFRVGINISSIILVQLIVGWSFLADVPLYVFNNVTYIRIIYLLPKEILMSMGQEMAAISRFTRPPPKCTKIPFGGSYNPCKASDFKMGKTLMYHVYLLIMVFCTVFHVISHPFPIHRVRIQIGLVVYFYQSVPISLSPSTFLSHLPKSHRHETPPQAEFTCLTLQLHCWALTSNQTWRLQKRLSLLRTDLRQSRGLRTQGKMVCSAANWCTHLIRSLPLQCLSNFRYTPSLLPLMEAIGLEGPWC